MAEAYILCYRIDGTIALAKTGSFGEGVEHVSDRRKISKRATSSLRWSRVDVQVSAIIAALVLLSFLCVYLFNYQITYREMMDTLKERSDSIYSFVEDTLDKSTFRAIDSLADVDDERDLATPAYREMKEALENIKIATGVRYLYTAKRDSDGTLVYVVDGLPATSEDFRNPGDPIEPEIVPEMERALNNEAVYPSDIKSTEWGQIFVTYYPVHEGDQVVGVVGIEFDAERQFQTFQMVRMGTPIIGIVFCLVAVCIAVMLFRRISNPAYRDLSNTDYLTGLKNRNAFEVDMANWRGESGPVAGVIMVDIDGLKCFNDRMGHSTGDELIKTAAHIVASRCEGLGPVYRTGGDEFVACCFTLSEEEAQAITTDLYATCRKTLIQDYPVSLSVGWALRSEGESIEQTCRLADARMYEEKERSRTSRKNSNTC